MPKYVFLTLARDFEEATIIKSMLQAEGLHPRVRDENIRSIAPHFGQALGKLEVEIPEEEFQAASLSLERNEPPRVVIVEETHDLEHTQALAKKCLSNAILGFLLVPLICNFYSMILGFRVLRMERPLSPLSRKRLLIAIGFNSIAFFIWFEILPSLLRNTLPFL